MYSAKSNSWKIADFGFSTEAHFTAAISTEDARGTASYRAPELFSDSPKFTKKADIWGLGCILYELAAREKAFAGDWDIFIYRTTMEAIRVPVGESIELQAKPHLTNLIQEMLLVDADKRPTAQDLHAIFDILAGSKSIENDMAYLPLIQRICRPLSSTECGSDTRVEERYNPI